MFLYKKKDEKKADQVSLPNFVFSLISSTKVSAQLIELSRLVFNEIKRREEERGCLSALWRKRNGSLVELLSEIVSIDPRAYISILHRIEDGFIYWRERPPLHCPCFYFNSPGLESDWSNSLGRVRKKAHRRSEADPVLRDGMGGSGRDCRRKKSSREYIESPLSFANKQNRSRWTQHTARGP